MGKGVVPNAAALILFEVVFSSRFTYDVRQLLYRAVGATALEFAWLPVSVLLTIVTVREITDARVNDWRHPRTAWSSLFTSAERARPWLLPLFSILVAKILRIAIITGTAHVWDQLTTAMSAALDHWQQEPEREDQLRAAVEIILEGAPYVLPIIPVRLLAVALICPLEVAMTRLAAQRSAESSSSNLNSDAESGVKPDDLGSETDQAVEPACRLTDTRYTGLVDCLWKIRKEEGWLQLYRGWWATLLFTAHGLTWEWILTFTYW
ncbi:hypothetical protein BKA62DRAFT_90928 [Auriculariales sp. MPI-PUGE-AT-0066]|nr:hypothetical protein BKA62DRAFT_90928 [Auriculariales sp. MPI-PUGE-AT-0066]